MNNEPAFDNFSSTVLVVFLKFLLFPTSFFSAIEKINNKNIVHFKYLPSFLSLTFRHIHSKKTAMDWCATIATNSPSRICVTQILHCTVQQRHDTWATYIPFQFILLRHQHVNYCTITAQQSAIIRCDNKANYCTIIMQSILSWLIF